MFAGRNGLAGVQRGGMADLRAVAERGVDVEHRHLADDGIVADGDGANFDPAGIGPIAVEVRIFADDGVVADRE